MSKRNPPALLIAALIATIMALLSSLSATASSIEPLDLATLDAKASLVINGYVVSVTEEKLSGLFEQMAVIRVASVLKGTYPERTLRVRTRVSLVFFDRTLARGDAGVFYLKKTPEGFYEAAYPGSFALFQNGLVRPLTK